MRCEAQETGSCGAEAGRCEVTLIRWNVWGVARAAIPFPATPHLRGDCEEEVQDQGVLLEARLVERV